jgi:hypothetical protein
MGALGTRYLTKYDLQIRLMQYNVLHGHRDFLGLACRKCTNRGMYRILHRAWLAGRARRLLGRFQYECGSTVARWDSFYGRRAVQHHD